MDHARSRATLPDARASRPGRAWPLAAVIALALAAHAVPLVNAAQTNSDACVVGLQAMHARGGEWSWFLWGSGYQTSVDSGIAAALFAVVGPGPRALMMESLGLHLGVIALAWSAIARRVDGVRAAIAVLPLVLASCPLETYVLYPPREAALALAVLAAWTFDRAADRGDARAAWGLAAGAAVLALACFADPYALVLAPPVGALGLACAIDRRSPRASGRRVGALALGAVVGLVPFVLVRASGHARGGPLALTAGAVTHNARLLVDPCLPWLVGARAWGTPGAAMAYAPWEAPPAVGAVQVAGGALFVVAIAIGGAMVLARGAPWPARRLAIAGGLALPVTMVGFLASPMVMDLFSARYLAAIPLLAPFALAPLAARMGRAWFAALVAPCVVATGIAGWIGLGPFRAPPADGAADEARLEAALAERGVRYGAADYWASYRLTFLAGERIVIVPVNEAEDRYPPYRAAFVAAPRVAYVYDPLRSREAPTWMRERVDAGATPFARSYETLRVGRFEVLLLTRPTT